MKKNTIPAVLTFSAFVVLGLSSCKKNDLTPTTSPVDQNVNPVTKNVLYEAGIQSNQGYPVDGQTNRGYYRMASNGSLGQQPVVNYAYFGGKATSTDPNGIKGFAATKNTAVYAYKTIDGVTFLNYNGTDIPVLLNGTTLFNYPIEEIEIYPITMEVFALAKVGSNMQVYRIDASGTATIMMVNGAYNIFNNTLGNGYKSGSICFVPNNPEETSFRLVYTSESQVYSSLGLVLWNFDIAGNNLTSHGGNTTYSTGTSGIPGALTGKINTTYGEGNFYFARDNSNLYTLNLSANNLPATQITTTPLQNANDFGYWKNL
jgi:hypothetical protein